MFKKIARDDKIFTSEHFLQDAIPFNVMISIVEDVEKYPTPKVFSNGKDCIIVCSSPIHPVIVWTYDSFNDYEALFSFIQKEFSENKPFKIMSKFNFYEFLQNKNKVDAEDIRILGAYRLGKLNDIKYVGHPDNITEDEVPVVAKLWVQFGQETGEDKEATMENRMDDARGFINSPLKKVWRDENNKIVTLAKLGLSEKYARFGHVITAPEERGKSYAKMLVHFFTKYSLTLGKEPMLFTDFEYIPSNKCYTAVGYELVCTIANYQIK